MLRKNHNRDASIIAERMNPLVGGEKVIIYKTSRHAIRVLYPKYAVVCNAHGCIWGADGLRDARVLMNNPGDFCAECHNLEGGTDNEEKQKTYRIRKI